MIKRPFLSNYLITTVGNRAIASPRLGSIFINNTTAKADFSNSSNNDAGSNNNDDKTILNNKNNKSQVNTRDHSRSQAFNEIMEQRLLIANTDKFKKKISKEESEEVKEEIKKVVGNKMFSQSQAYNPLELYMASKSGDMGLQQRFKAPARIPRPTRLVITGKEFHYTNVWFLSRFLTPMGRIMPRWKTGLSKKKQIMLKKNVKKARQLGLLPYLHKYSAGPLEMIEGEAAPNRLSCPVSFKEELKVLEKKKNQNQEGGLSSRLQ